MNWHPHVHLHLGHTRRLLVVELWSALFGTPRILESKYVPHHPTAVNEGVPIGPTYSLANIVPAHTSHPETHHREGSQKVFPTQVVQSPSQPASRSSGWVVDTGMDNRFDRGGGIRMTSSLKNVSKPS